MKGGCGCNDVVVTASVVVPQELHGMGDAQVVVQEAREEGIHLVGTQVFLSCPVQIVLGKP
jgi:hypothetical protein